MLRSLPPVKSAPLRLLPWLAALVICLLLAGCDDGGRQPTGTPATAGENQLRAITLTRDYRNARLALEVTVHNPTTNPAPLAPPFARLLDGEGREIPPFFLAFNQPPTVAPGESGNHELTFWLEESHLAGELWLSLGETTRLAVKDATPFLLDSLENQASSDFTGPRWGQGSAD